jgi:hypothetical protein
MKFAFFKRSTRFDSTFPEPADEKELAAFFTMLSVLIFMVGHMTGPGF